MPAPPEAIGGTVDQADLDGLKELLDATGWKVTLGAPHSTPVPVDHTSATVTVAPGTAQIITFAH